MGKRVSDLEREVSLLKNRLSKAESFDGSRIVRSGNSRVKVTVYGQVSRSVRFAFDKHNTEVHHVDQDGSGSRLGFLAQGRIDPDLAISARTEVEWQYNRRSGTRDDNGDTTERLRARHVDLWTDHKDLGQLWLGKGSIASDAATLISLSGTSWVFAFHGPGADDSLRASQDGRANAVARHGFLAFTGQRQSRIMYATPNVMGFRALVSHSEKDRIAAGLRYGGSPFGMKNVRAAMRFGWVKLPGDGATVSKKAASVAGVGGEDPTLTEHSHTPASGGGAGDAEAYGVSGGIMHVPTGLNLSGSYASRDNNDSAVDPDMFAMELGWTGSIWGMGATSVSVGYGRWNDWEGGGGGFKEGRTERYHVAVNQNVDPAATDVYFGVSYDDGKNGEMERESVVIVVTGIRIKF